MLLCREIELAQLERQILDLDDLIVENDPDDLMSWQVLEKDENCRKLNELMADVAEKLKDYGKITPSDASVTPTDWVMRR